MYQITKKELFTIPNLLSYLRIMLAVVFLAVFYSKIPNKILWLGVIVAVSGLSDFLDGKIARRFNMVTELGKLIDPIADKLTQGVLLFCLMSQYQAAKYVFLLFCIKEVCMGIFGTMTMVHTGRNDGAKWFGKINTAVFYAVMLILIFFRNLSVKAAETLLIVCGMFLFFAFMMYMWEYFRKGRRNGHTA